MVVTAGVVVVAAGVVVVVVCRALGPRLRLCRALALLVVVVVLLVVVGLVAVQVFGFGVYDSTAQGRGV